MNHLAVIQADSVEATLDLGRRIGSALQVGWVVGLVGPLGVGKTHLVKGIASGNGRPGCETVGVTSPTFVLVNEYPGRILLYHLDAYRLQSDREFVDVGLEEMIAEGAVVVEWADRVEHALPPDRLIITGEYTGETSRAWTLSAAGPASREWLRCVS